MQATGENTTSGETPPGLWVRFGRWLEGFLECDPAGSATRTRFRRVICYIHRLSDAFATHQCSLMACACAFCALLSLVPLLILGIAGLGFFLGSRQEAMDQVMQAVYNYVPVRYDTLRDILNHVMNERRVLSAFGLGGLLFGAHQTFLAMQPAMNLVWGVTESRHWIVQRLIAIGATLYTLVLMGGNIVATTVFAYLASVEVPSVLNAAQARLLQYGLALLPMLFTTLLFALLYRILPSRNVPWKAALLGGLVAAALWELTKIGFGYSLRYITSYDRLYGPLASLVILVVWMFYSMTILLLGAEITADWLFMKRGEKAAEARAHSGADLTAATGQESAVTEQRARQELEATPGG